MNSNEASYKISNIYKSFAHKNILNNLNYEFKGNKIYAILGESGSGKTTLLNIIGCIDKMHDGEIVFNNKQLNTKIDNFKFRNANIGYIFQSYYLIDYLTVRENILMPLEYSEQKVDKEYLEYLLKTLNIEGIADEKTHYLSGGEKQRVSIARALVAKPKIVICDEPTGNLDEANSFQVVSVLKKFVDATRIIIIVTHDKTLASMCDATLTLKDGRINETK